MNDKSVTLVIKAGKLTGKLLAKAIRKFLAAQAQLKQGKGVPKIYRGKQSVKKLIRQNQGVSNIEITDSNIKGFERTARKYGVDFALKKDKSTVPPKWLVFFKARDADALTAAFSEFSAKTLRNDKARPSVLQTLRKLVELVKNQVADKTRQKEHGGHER